MKKAMSYAKEFFHRADIFLLVMGLICAIFGIVVISSATASYHSAKYGIVQSASATPAGCAFSASVFSRRRSSSSRSSSFWQSRSAT